MIGQLATPPGDKPISSELSRALVSRILASNSFSKSDRLSKFLKYSFQKTAEGRPQDLSEYQVGLNVFGRSDRYSPGDDSIVRSHARLLRQRLDGYFKNEGKDEEIIATIPKGSYSLHFDFRHVAAAPAVVEPVVIVEPPPPLVAVKRPWWLAIALMALVALTAAMWILRPQSLVESVWNRVFTRNTRTIIVPADSTLALFEDLSNQVIPLSDYVNHRFSDRAGPSAVANNLWASGRRYTSMADLQVSTRLMRLPEAQAREVVIRYARDLQMADLKGSNCVLLGGVRANPWQEVFQDKLNFRIGYDAEHDENRVINTAPHNGERASYNERSDSSYHRAYGLIAWLPSLSSDSSVVIIQGTSTAGTEAAADFLFDNQRFEEFLRLHAAGKNVAPFFEALLQTESVSGNAQRATVIAARVITPPSA